MTAPPAPVAPAATPPAAAVPSGPRYVALPNVTAVVEGPEHRRWYHVRGTLKRTPSLQEAKDSLTQQFAAPAPRLLGLTPMLFEPSGRIWFLFSGHLDDARPGITYQLIGYDGKEFIQRPFASSRAPGTQNESWAHTALYIDNTAFFVTGTAIYSYNDKGWSVRQFDGPGRGPSYNRSARGDIHLLPELDRKGMVAVRGGELWRYRDGSWKELPGSPLRANGDNAIASAACAVDGVWSLAGGRLSFVAWNAKPGPTLEALLEQLNAPAAADRDAATQALIDRGYEIQGAVEQAMLRAPNTDVRYRLEHILGRIRGTLGGDPDPAPSTTIGAYRIRAPLYLASLPAGDTLIVAQEIVDASSGPVPVAVPAGGSSDRPDHPDRLVRGKGGVLLISPKGKARLLDDEEMLTAFAGVRNHNSGYQPGSICLVDGGPLMWVSAIREDHDYVSLVDLAAGKVLRTTDTPFPAHPILADRNSLIYRYPSEFLEVRSDVPDDKAALKPTTVVPINAMDGGKPAFAQGPDGVVWCYGPQGLSLVERGQLFQLPFASEVRNVTAIVPGAGAALVVSGPRWYFVTYHAVTHGGLLEDVIRDNREAVVKAFSTTRSCYTAQPVYLQADRDGNLWLTRPESQQLQVLAGNQWIDARPDLTTAGLPLGRTSVVFPVGDRSRMYVAEPWRGSPARGSTPATEYPTAVLASCNNGRLSFEACPGLVDSSDGRPLAWSDSHGDLWLNVRDTPGSNGLVAHLNVTGLSSQTSGRLLAIDADDHPWVYLYRTAEGELNPAPLQLLVNNKQHPLPEVPFVISSTRVLPSTRRNVYVTTTLGVQSLRAGGTAENPTFAIGPRFEQSPAGILASEDPSPTDLLTGVAPGRQTVFELQFFPLPR
jgi:hypothetical protein